MKIVTINIPNQYLDCIETMVNMGFYPSRSEAVRQALKQFLAREADFNTNLGVEEFKALKETQYNVMIQ